MSRLRWRSHGHPQHAGATRPDRHHARWCYDDLAAIPDDRNRYEIIDGELIATPVPWVRHQIVVGNVMALFCRKLDHAGQPQRASVWPPLTDAVLGPRRVVKPDVMVLRRDRHHLLTEFAIEGVPDLIVEVLSPVTVAVDRGRKQRLYGEVGVPEYWLADPEARTLEILTPDAAGVMQLCGTYGAGDTAVSPTFGFEFAVADVFAE